MPHANTRDEERPTAEEIRAALDRIAVSEAFRASSAARRLPALCGRSHAARRAGSHQGLHDRRRSAWPRRRFQSAGRSDRSRRGDAFAPRPATLLRQWRQRRFRPDRSAARKLCAGVSSFRVTRRERALPRKRSPRGAAWHAFLAFLTAYLDDDRAAASRYAALIPSEAYPLDLVAGALIAAHRGQIDAARELLHRLDASLPEGREDAGAEFARFPLEAMASRIARDLAQREGIAAKPKPPRRARGTGRPPAAACRPAR